MPHPGSALCGERRDIEVRLDWDFCNGRPTHRQAQRLELAYKRKFSRGVARADPSSRGRRAASF